MNFLDSVSGRLQSLSEAASKPVRSRHQTAEGDLLQLKDSSSLDSNRHIDQAMPRVENFLFFIVDDSHGGKSELLKHVMGLSETLEGRGGISAYLPEPNALAALAIQRPTLYYRNGILVGHTGRKITPEDVANALAEE